MGPAALATGTVEAASIVLITSASASVCACRQNNSTQQEECIAVQNDLDKHLFSWTDYGDSQGSLW